MFPLRRPARQIVATFTLGAFLVLPTLAITFHAWRIQQPGHVREHEQALSRFLGLHVSLADVEFPRPGERILNDVILRREQAASNPTLLAELIRIPRLRIVEEPDAITLHADNILLSSSSPDSLADHLDAFASRSWPGVSRVNLLVANASWRSNIDEAQTREFPLCELAATIQGGSAEQIISATYRWGDSHESPRCELVWDCSPTANGLLTDILVQFDESPAPASLLEPWLAANSWFGSEATIKGLIRFQRLDHQPWQAHFEGSIHDLDLDRLLTTHFPGASLSGRANLEIARAEWGPLPRGQGLGWIEVRGRLDARDGSMSTQFLNSLANDLHFRHEAVPSQPEIPYSRLAFSFNLDSSGQLTISGDLGSAHPRGAVLLSKSESNAPLLLAPEAAASVRGLWKALFPSRGDVLVPATAESQILRHLPLPPAGPTPLRAN